MSAADEWQRLDAYRNKMLAAKPSNLHTAPDATSEQGDDGVVLTCAASLTPSPVSWLWRGWLAQGKLHILAGAPGQGKTTLALSLAATITTGGCWPDGTRSPSGNVVIWSGEDDPADTLLPRLLAMGADPHCVHFITGARVGSEVVPFDPARDMTQLLAKAEQIGDVRLLIVDPIVSAVIEACNQAQARSAYADIVRCVEKAAQAQSINEAESLRDVLLSVATPALAKVQDGGSTLDVQQLARSLLRERAKLFSLSVANKCLTITLESSIMKVPGFPLTLAAGDDAIKVVNQRLELVHPADKTTRA